MAIKVIDHGSDDYKQMIALRQLLLRKPLGLSFSDEELAEEVNDILIGCFDEDKLEGCCLLTESVPGVLRLRQMAVISGLQGKGVGRVILQFAENIARDRGYKKMTMHARKTALGFYEKLGFKVIHEEDVPIGPYWMNDYVMRLSF